MEEEVEEEGVSLHRLGRFFKIFFFFLVGWSTEDRLSR